MHCERGDLQDVGLGGRWPLSSDVLHPCDRQRWVFLWAFVCVSSLTRFTGGGKDRVYWCVVSFQLIATESSLLCLLCTSWCVPLWLSSFFCVLAPFFPWWCSMSCFSPLLFSLVKQAAGAVSLQLTLFRWLLSFPSKAMPSVNLPGIIMIRNVLIVVHCLSSLHLLISSCTIRVHYCHAAFIIHIP